MRDDGLLPDVVLYRVTWVHCGYKFGSILEPGHRILKPRSSRELPGGWGSTSPERKGHIVRSPGHRNSPPDSEKAVSSLLERRRQEEGVVLLLVLGFVAFVGLLSVALLNYSATSLLSATRLESLRTRQLMADGVIDGAINVVRPLDAPASLPANPCFSYTLGNGQAYRVDCSGNTVDTTFLACQSSVACTPGSTILTAGAHYERSLPSPRTTVTITKWSVKK